MTEKPQPVSVTIGLDTVVAYEYGYDEPGGPITIADRIVEAATEQLVKSCEKDIRAAVVKRVDVEINARVADVIAETLAKPIQRTDDWGTPKGETTTIRELIGEEASRFMTTKRDGYGRPDSYGKAEFQRLLQKEVSDAMTKELREVMTKARNDAIAAVKAQASTLIGDAVKRAMQG